MAAEASLKSKNHIKQSLGSQIFDICNAIFMILFCITIIIPFWDMLVKSFSRASDISYMNLNFWPAHWTWDAYVQCFKDDALVHALFISVSRTVIGTTLHLIVCCMAAYALTRNDMPFHKLFTVILLIPMFFSGGMIPSYINIKSLGLLNNFLVYILPSAFSIYNTIIIRNYFFSIDAAMEEAASIDGASKFRIFFTIILPLAKPVLATVCLWQMVGQWNSWFDNMIYCREENLLTMQYLLRKLNDQMQMASTTEYEMQMMQNSSADFNSETVKAATTILVVMPIVLVYPFLQKYFVKGIMVGAVKG